MTKSSLLITELKELLKTSPFSWKSNTLEPLYCTEDQVFSSHIWIDSKPKSFIIFCESGWQSCKVLFPFQYGNGFILFLYFYLNMFTKMTDCNLFSGINYHPILHYTRKDMVRGHHVRERSYNVIVTQK